MPPTLKDVARATGYAVATVSYALRGSPHVSAETQKRIREVAEQLGYRPNPQITALMTQVRRAQPLTAGERLGLIWVDLPAGTVLPRIHNSVVKRAAQHGYELEEFWLRDSGMTPSRLAQVLRARGINGVLLSPLQESERIELNWDWSSFAFAIIGNAASDPELHHAGHHQFLGMHDVLADLRAKEVERVGCVLIRRIDERAKRAQSGAFLIHHPQGMRAAVESIRFEESSSPATLKTWIRKSKFQALVTNADTLDRLCEAGFDPGGLQVRLINWDSRHSGYGGIEIDEPAIAASAVDLAVGQLNRNERGLPSSLKTVLCPGIWHEARP